MVFMGSGWPMFLRAIISLDHMALKDTTQANSLGL